MEKLVLNIGQSIQIKGELTGNEDLTIEGKVDGKVVLKDHNLTIGANGKITAEIQAKTVMVLGEVVGNISADDKVELVATGRLVTGFLATEWNDFGNYFTVRQRDAHAWVEVYYPRSGWVTIDPTPASTAAPSSSVWEAFSGSANRSDYIGTAYSFGTVRVTSWQLSIASGKGGIPCGTI